MTEKYEARALFTAEALQAERYRAERTDSRVNELEAALAEAWKVIEPFAKLQVPQTASGEPSYFHPISRDDIRAARASSG